MKMKLIDWYMFQPQQAAELGSFNHLVLSLGILCHYMMEACDMLLILILQGDYSCQTDLSLRRDFGLLNIVETGTDYGPFEFGLNAFFQNNMAQDFGDQGVECGG